MRVDEEDLSSGARALRKAMADQGLRQCDIVDVFNGHTGWASEIVNGRRPISKALALRLSKRLKISVEELLTG